jgi:polygalacturonase
MTTYDILDFGACPDGRTLNTESIQQAIDACHQAGGGQVVCPPGTYLIGTIDLRSRVELHLSAGCRLVGSPNLADYTPLVAEGFRPEGVPEHSILPLLRSVDAEDAAITGHGVINGSGPAFYADPTGVGKLDKPKTPRPRLGMFYRCRRLRITDVRFENAASWTLWLMQCEGVAVHRVSIHGDRRLRNIDGIDIDACREVTLSDCRIDTEDDAIVLRAIQGIYEAPAVCEHITVANCVLRSRCQGVRVGCPSDGPIRNCTFTNLVIESSRNGIAFDNPRGYLDPGDSGRAHIENILFSNVVIYCELSPIRIVVEEGIKLNRLADLRFANFRIHSGSPCIIQGCPETILHNIQFSDMQIETSGDDALLCRYCDGLSLNHVELCSGSKRVPQVP